VVTVLYPFDGNANDLNGDTTGVAFGSAAVVYNQGSYVGTGSLYLTATSFQYVEIPYVNLSQSFTIEVWISPTTPAVFDFAIFNQIGSNNKSLTISLRNQRVTLSFDSMNASNVTLVGQTVLTITSNPAIWAHVAVVYNAELYQQQIYVNGIIDAVSNGIVLPFAGTSSGSITTVGRCLSSAYGASYFNG
jgi:hypothetical protein